MQHTIIFNLRTQVIVDICPSSLLVFCGFGEGLQSGVRGTAGAWDAGDVAKSHPVL